MTAKKKTKNALEEDTDRLVSSIDELVQMKKLSTKEELRYLSIYKNLDRMLVKLPEETVEDLNMEFVKLTYDAIKDQRYVTLG